VISPLQALMKDQVDNLVKKTGTLFADAISGLQTMPERGEVFERVRLGDTAILYISSEQLRSIGVRNVLQQREIGYWVFDEAHCLSKWGHDFRPDYLYAARFIREYAREQNQEIPPIACFTATAKKDVIEEITNHFREELGHDLLLYQGGVERENLSFEVIPVSTAEKFQQTQEIIESQLKEDSKAPGVIVYAATRKSTEEIAEFLQHQGILAEAFHAGLEAGRKREIIADFVSGQIPVICATNAFGMGIDKENIRLVLHFEMPGSLENYIQEAGRAGRDLKPARCVLLYDPKDAGRQFHMGALSEVKRQEIAQLLRALRRKKPNQQGEIVVTSDELLRDEDMADLRLSMTEGKDTKVRASIAWLERAGFLQRNQNLTEVFQGKTLVKSLEEAKQVMERLDLSSHTQNMWLRILHQLINAADHHGCSADYLAESMFSERHTLQQMEKATGLTAAQIVIMALHDMADAGLIDQGVTLSASFRPKGKNNSTRLLESACDLENSLVKILQEEDPDAENGNWVLLNIRRLNQMLKNEGYETTPDVLRQLIKGISYDGKGFAASQGSFEIGYIDRNRYQMRLQRSWENLRRTIFLRQNVARVILKTLIDMAKKLAAEKGIELTGELEMSFTSDELSAAIKSDIALRSEVKKVLPAIDRGLMFLHEQKAITLQGGLAVLRQAMSIRLSPNAKGRYYNKGDYKPLAVYYREKRLQVHVMMRYAELALEKIAKALGLVFDYFALGRAKFVNKYFPDEKELIEKATTAESYRQIVEKLRNPVQISAVGKPVEDNMLILAGPGSGKTTVIVHRCAYLLEVERVPARQILVLCFNHSSAIMLRKRLIKLVGKPAAGVTVATYHGAAMRLAGISIRDMAGSHKEGDIDFDSIIRGAVSLLKGEKEISGIERDEMRDRLLGSYTHILVDEYQDIDEAQYDFVSAIAGRSLAEEDGRLTLLAVGDDDQNIYTFRGANVRFIRRFQEDYSTHIVYLVENYRSSRHIIAASNLLIRNNQDRMKGTHPICINRDREKNLPGGKWSKLDPVSQGRVQIVTVEDWPHQALHIIRKVERLKAIDPSVKNDDFSVLARTKAPLNAVRSVLEEAEIPIKMTIDKALPLQRVREINVALEWLKLNEKQNLNASDLQKELHKIRGDKGINIWWQLVDSFLQGYIEETSDSILPVSWAIDRFYEFLVEQRREKMVGQGIFLSTVHSAKGMEFPHVFVLDGDWKRGMGKLEREEERRVMYVAMTRAEQTLHLFKIPGRENPFLKEIRGDFVIPLNDRIAEDRCDQRQFEYEMLGLNEIYLDYAACYPDGHPIHRYLAAIETGCRVSFGHKNGKIDILDESGRCLARLSKEGTDKWSGKLSQLSDLRVVAMIQRTEDDPDMGFYNRIKASKWELPVLEAVLSHSE
jgi:ATP-dependent DNA helicase RecQ